MTVNVAIVREPTRQERVPLAVRDPLSESNGSGDEQHTFASRFSSQDAKSVSRDGHNNAHRESRMIMPISTAGNRRNSATESSEMKDTSWHVILADQRGPYTVSHNSGTGTSNPILEQAR